MATRLLRTLTPAAFLALGTLIGWLLFRATAAHEVRPGVPWMGLQTPLAWAFQVLGGVLGFKFASMVQDAFAPPAPGRTTHGSARFADERDVRAELGGGGLIVGRELTGAKLLRYAGPSHLITIAPTRSGKGVGAIVPNLLTADRSVFCVDPKGENARITLRARRRFGPVYVLDPFEISGTHGAAFNPLSALDSFGIDLAEDAAGIAEALVHDPPGQVADAHWNEEARALIAGLILHVVCSEPPERRTLSLVRRYLTCPAPEFCALMRKMGASGDAHGLVARAANRQLAKSDREAAGVLSSAQRHTHFLDSPRMTRVMERSDFSFADLKAETATVFLVLPPDRMAVHARWLRLMTCQALGDLARAPSRSTPPVLFLLDEFAALGRLEPVERAFGLMAGYGVQLWPILQDIHQLRSTYGERAGTFLSNAGVLQLFNVADIDTATWVSRSLGAATQVYSTASASTSSSPMQPFDTHGSGSAVHEVRRDLLTPDEVMRLAWDQALLLRPGGAPALVRKVRYFADGEFANLM